jgi:hypothetical protein
MSHQQQAAVWQWESDDGSKFIPFDSSDAEQLEQALNRGLATFQHPSRPWLFNLEMMTQTNTTSTSKRTIKRVAATRSAAASVPVLWRWQNDECTGYNDFNAEYSQRLEQAYNSSRQQIFVIPERNWQFDFMSMTQLNPSTQSLRSIKRFVDQSIAGTSAAAAQPMQPSSAPPIHQQSTAAGHYVPAPAPPPPSQVEARRRIAGGGVPSVVDAAQSGDAEAVELHVIADAGAVNVRDK